ncbi:hypothetical protein Catovirus_1_63 [Catovirus CTV1]|uniref:Uncharacterized protein n=1 Tax=Catovirus CTV1 TaxID=1977631 RepID=A0A1V0S8H9_9VIRU|nr:hypothetical protein Catovirus_1_63 [Catovirus CTV1]
MNTTKTNNKYCVKRKDEYKNKITNETVYKIGNTISIKFIGKNKVINNLLSITKEILHNHNLNTKSRKYLKNNIINVAIIKCKVCDDIDTMITNAIYSIRNGIIVIDNHSDLKVSEQWKESKNVVLMNSKFYCNIKNIDNLLDYNQKKYEYIYSYYYKNNDIILREQCGVSNYIEKIILRIYEILLTEKITIIEAYEIVKNLKENFNISPAKSLIIFEKNKITSKIIPNIISKIIEDQLCTKENIIIYLKKNLLEMNENHLQNYIQYILQFTELKNIFENDFDRFSNELLSNNFFDFGKIYFQIYPNMYKDCVNAIIKKLDSGKIFSVTYDIFNLCCQYDNNFSNTIRDIYAKAINDKINNNNDSDDDYCDETVIIICSYYPELINNIFDIFRLDYYGGLSKLIENMNMFFDEIVKRRDKDKYMMNILVNIVKICIEYDCDDDDVVNDIINKIINPFIELFSFNRIQIAKYINEQIQCESQNLRTFSEKLAIICYFKSMIPNIVNYEEIIKKDWINNISNFEIIEPNDSYCHGVVTEFKSDGRIIKIQHYIDISFINVIRNLFGFKYFKSLMFLYEDTINQKVKKIIWQLN